MQRIESFGLRGIMRSARSNAELADMADAMVRRALDSVATKGHQTQLAPKSARPSPRTEKPKRTVRPPLERRPLRSVTQGGAARLHHGADLVWALNELRRADPAVLRAQLVRDPALLLRAAANLDRIEAQLRRGRPGC